MFYATINSVSTNQPHVLSDALAFGTLQAAFNHFDGNVGYDGLQYNGIGHWTRDLSLFLTVIGKDNLQFLEEYYKNVIKGFASNQSKAAIALALRDQTKCFVGHAQIMVDKFYDKMPPETNTNQEGGSAVKRLVSKQIVVDENGVRANTALTDVVFYTFANDFGFIVGLNEKYYALERRTMLSNHEISYNSLDECVLSILNKGGNVYVCKHIMEAIETLKTLGCLF